MKSRSEGPATSIYAGALRRPSPSPPSRDDRAGPVEKVVHAHEVQDPLSRYTRPQGRSDAEVDPSELPVGVRIGADRHTYTALARKAEELDVEVLPVGIGVDLDGLVERCGLLEDPLPVRGQAESVVVDASARVSEDVQSGMPQSGEISLGLV